MRKTDEAKSDSVCLHAAMSRSHWKAREREIAVLLGARRYPANTGGLVDVEGPIWLAQVKERKTLSLAWLEHLALEMERIGAQKGKLGVVAIKRSGGRGRSTPWLLIVTEAVWRQMHGSGSA